MTKKLSEVKEFVKENKELVVMYGIMVCMSFALGKAIGKNAYYAGYTKALADILSAAGEATVL